MMTISTENNVQQEYRHSEVERNIQRFVEVVLIDRSLSSRRVGASIPFRRGTPGATSQHLGRMLTW